MRSFIEPDVFDNNVPIDNTTSIYLINLPCILGLRSGLDLKLHHFSIFSLRIKKTTNEHLIFREFHERYNIVLKERTHSINNKMNYSKSAYE